MGQGMSLHANFAGIEQYGSDIGSHAGANVSCQAQARQIATKACEELGYGAGSSQHSAVMAKLDSLFEEHISNVNLHRSGTVNAGETFQAAGKRMQMRMGQTQI